MTTVIHPILTSVHKKYGITSNPPDLHGLRVGLFHEYSSSVSWYNLSNVDHDVFISGTTKNQERGMYFDGIDNCLILTGDADERPYLHAVTFGCWCKIMTNPETQIQFLISDSMINNVATYELYASPWNSGGFRARVYEDASQEGVTVNSDVDPFDGLWHLVIGTVECGVLYIYVDGVLKNSAYLNQEEMAKGGTLYIGCRGIHDRYYTKGNIDNVFVCNNRTYSVTEQHCLYERTKKFYGR